MQKTKSLQQKFLLMLVLLQFQTTGWPAFSSPTSTLPLKFCLQTAATKGHRATLNAATVTDHVDGCKGFFISSASHNAAHGRQVIEEATGGPIRGVHRAQEPPSFGHQLSDSCGAQLSKVGTSVHRPEMGQVSANIRNMRRLSFAVTGEAESENIVPVC